MGCQGNSKGQVEWYKHSQLQSSLQPLDPIKQAAICKDTTGSVAVFYTTRPQQVFVMCR